MKNKRRATSGVLKGNVIRVPCAQRRWRRWRYVIRGRPSADGQRRQVRTATGGRNPRTHVVVMRCHGFNRFTRVVQPFPGHCGVVRRGRQRRVGRRQLVTATRPRSHAHALLLPVLHVQQVRVPALRVRGFLAHRHRYEYVTEPADRRQNAGAELWRRWVH